MTSSISSSDTWSVEHGRNGIAHRGVDADPSARPGVPMETEPHPLPGAQAKPEMQPPVPGLTKRMELGNSTTPVFGTAQPLRGPAALLRRTAYAVPEHRPKHWLLLLLADRTDSLADRLSRPTTWFFLALPLVAAGIAVARLRRA